MKLPANNFCMLSLRICLWSKFCNNKPLVSFFLSLSLSLSLSVSLSLFVCVCVCVCVCVEGGGGGSSFFPFHVYS